MWSMTAWAAMWEDASMIKQHHSFRYFFREGLENLRSHGWAEITHKLYPEMRHEVLNEVGKEEVWADLVQTLMGWLRRR